MKSAYFIKLEAFAVKLGMIAQRLLISCVKVQNMPKILNQKKLEGKMFKEMIKEDEKQRSTEALNFASLDAQTADFIAMYARFIEDSTSCLDRLRMAKFAARIDEEWLKIPEAKREILARALLAKKLLPDEVETALRVFDAKVVSVV